MCIWTIMHNNIYTLKVHVKHIKITSLTDAGRKIGIKGERQRERKGERQTLLSVWTRVTPFHPVSWYYLLSTTPQCDYLLNVSASPDPHNDGYHMSVSFPCCILSTWYCACTQWVFKEYLLKEWMKSPFFTGGLMLTERKPKVQLKILEKMFTWIFSVLNSRFHLKKDKFLDFIQVKQIEQQFCFQWYLYVALAEPLLHYVIHLKWRE